MDITKTDISILLALSDLKATNKAYALNVKAIAKECSLCVMTIKRHIKYLLRRGYVERGYQECRAYTYYITTSGENILPDKIDCRHYEYKY